MYSAFSSSGELLENGLSRSAADAFAETYKRVTREDVVIKEEVYAGCSQAVFSAEASQ
jgi:hypothetical protein